MTDLSQGMPDETSGNGIEPDMAGARRIASMAHSVLAKLQEMDLPEDYSDDLATMSVDLGDIWGAQRELTRLLDQLLKAPHDWETVGGILVDLDVAVQHISSHVATVREPMNRIAQFAYEDGGGTS